MAETMSLEAAMRRLDEIVSEMDDGDTTLERSMQLYSEGIALSERCLAMIRDAKQVVEQGKERIEESLR